MAAPTGPEVDHRFFLAESVEQLCDLVCKHLEDPHAPRPRELKIVPQPHPHHFFLAVTRPRVPDAPVSDRYYY